MRLSTWFITSIILEYLQVFSLKKAANRVVLLRNHVSLLDYYTKILCRCKLDFCTEVSAFFPVFRVERAKKNRLPAGTDLPGGIPQGGEGEYGGGEVRVGT